MPTASTPIPIPELGVIGVNGQIALHARVITTTSGTVDTTKSWGASVTYVKTATKTGRYTFTLPKAYVRLLNVMVMPIGVDNAVWGAATTGLQWFLRDEDVSAASVAGVSTSAADGTFEIQFCQDSYADAELPDGTGFMITIFVASGGTV